MTRSVSAAAVLFVCMTGRVTLRAETIRVPDDFPTLSAGIAAARDGDTVLVADGNYTGAANRNLDCGGKDIVVRSENGPEHCIIDCERDGRAFVFDSGAASVATIEGLTLTGGSRGAIFCGRDTRPTLRNCLITNNTNRDSGGGIEVLLAELRLESCRIVNNATSYRGGGIAAESSRITMDRCQISGNRTDYPGDSLQGLGGGLYLFATDIDASNCVIRENYADRYGGGMYCGGTHVATLTDCIFEDNAAYAGGGGAAYVSGTLERCLFRRNQAVGRDGGGIIADAAVLADCVIAENTAERGLAGGVQLRGSSLTRCTIAGNTAAAGGGVVASTDSLVQDCMIVGNRAIGEEHYHYGGGLVLTGDTRLVQTVITGNSAVTGGGVYSTAGESRLDNLVVYSNTARSGGGLFVAAGQPRVGSSIIRGNTADESPQIGGAALVLYSNVSGGFPGDGNIDADPGFVDPDTGDLRLMAGSPCIDAGDNRTQWGQLTTDLDGNVRRVDDPATPDTGRGRRGVTDMGVYEFASPPACTGAEVIKAKCVESNGVYAVTVRLRAARPDARLTIALDGMHDGGIVGRINRHGRLSVRFEEAGAGRHAVEPLECGASDALRCR